jgi:DNA-binding MurR/RpiR family transcriptional regulator
MGFRAVVAKTDLSTTPAEMRVLNVLLSDDDVVDAPAAEVGSRAKTHESTVIRLAQKLGYRGYPELRADLHADATVNHSSTGMRTESGWTLAELARDEARDLQRLHTFITQDAMDAAAATIETADRVYLVATVEVLPVLQLMDRRLRRLGIPVITMTRTTKDLAENLVSFDADSVLIAFALRETPTYLSRVMTEAKRRGGRTILITDTPGFTFRPQPDHLLAAVRTADANYNTLLIPMTVCYALQLAVFHRDPARFQRLRDDIDDLIRLTGGPDEIPLRS